MCFPRCLFLPYICVYIKCIINVYKMFESHYNNNCVICNAWSQSWVIRWFKLAGNTRMFHVCQKVCQSKSAQEMFTQNTHKHVHWCLCLVYLLFYCFSSSLIKQIRERMEDIGSKPTYFVVTCTCVFGGMEVFFCSISSLLTWYFCLTLWFCLCVSGKSHG